MKALPCSLALLAGALLLPGHGSAQQPVKSGAASSQNASPVSGPADFNFEIGTWKTHIKTLKQPLTGSSVWRELDGTTVVQKIGDGQAHLLELDVSGADRHLHAINLRLYNSVSHQWSLNFARLDEGILNQPTIGEFHNGRGEFYDQETFNGKAIFVRFIITVLSPNACHYEQAFSADGGKTWEVNWIADDTRVK
jgi:hypothetical protein